MLPKCCIIKNALSLRICIIHIYADYVYILNCYFLYERKTPNLRNKTLYTVDREIMEY